MSCNSGYTCAAFSTFVGCCSTGAAGCEVLYTTCFDIVGQTCDASCSADRGALQWLVTNQEPIFGTFLTKNSGQPVPYCALYRYTSGSVGYGCAGYAGYNKTVLETSTAAVIPFGQSATTTSSSSTSSISSTSSTSSSPTSTLAATMTPSATAAANNLLLISGGAIAGIVVASVLVLAAIGGLIWFFLRRRRTNQRQAAEAAQSSHPSYPYQDRYIYAQYAKNDPSTLSSPRSRANHSRDPSDQYAGSHSELGGRSVSPQTIMSPTFSDGGHILPAELPAMDEVSLGGNVSKQT